MSDSKKPSQSELSSYRKRALACLAMALVIIVGLSLAVTLRPGLRVVANSTILNLFQFAFWQQNRIVPLLVILVLSLLIGVYYGCKCLMHTKK